MDEAAATTNGTPTPKHDLAKPGILVLRDFCTRLWGSNCERCSLACPAAAISFNERNEPTINTAICTGCGICMGICDAFTSARITMLDLHARTRRIALRGEDVVLTCKENVFPGLEVAANVVVLPCLAVLSPEFWTLVLAEKTPISIATDLSYCDTCSRAGDMGEVLFSHAIKTAERWTGRRVQYRSEIPEKENLVKDLLTFENVDRRNVFTNLASDVVDAASGKRRLRNSEVLQQFYERKERARALARLNLNESPRFNDFVPEGRIKQTMYPKRRMLLEAIDKDSSIAQNISLLLSKTDASLCTNTLACCNVCPTKARFPHPESGMLAFDVRYCIGCGLCVMACPEHAISLCEETACALMEETS